MLIPRVTQRCFWIVLFVLFPSAKGIAGDTECGAADICDFRLPDIRKDCCAVDSVKYEMTLEGIWSRQTHPKDFPENAWLLHFSDLIGASHSANFRMWEEGGLSTDGFRQVAEWGSVRKMENELKEKKSFIRSIFKAKGLWHPNVNGNTSAVFCVDPDRHVVSLATMIGPSPDWIVGVPGLELCREDCSWVNNYVVQLYLWDAGTDSGITYTSPNEATVPREKIRRITNSSPNDPRAPFYDPTGAHPMKPLAKLHVRKVDGDRSCVDDGDSLRRELGISENTESVDRPECAVDEWSSWSECSVSCGKGLRMRQRTYKNVAKAEMMGCDRQLLSKEFCAADIPECSSEEDEDPICAVTNWTPWSPCSASCGKGMKTRTRRYKNRMGRKKCSKELMEKEMCQADVTECQEESIDPECRVSEWNDWSPCSVTCGEGKRMRSRIYLIPDYEEANCNVQMVQTTTCTGEKPSCSLSSAEAKDICMLDPSAGPCRGNFMRWHFHPQKQMCVQFAYGGCRGNQNNFMTYVECKTTCEMRIGVGAAPSAAAAAAAAADPLAVSSMEEAKAVCMQPLTMGSCAANFQRWHYDFDKGMCIPFKYTGCDANDNNFMTYVDCKTKCEMNFGNARTNNPEPTPPLLTDRSPMEEAKAVCMQPQKVGKCLGYFKRWYYDFNKGMCVPFTFGGCGGNDNNFPDYVDCKMKCEMVLANVGSITDQNEPEIPQASMETAKEICMKPMEVGKCAGTYQRWFYVSEKAMCAPFAYGGCGGNENNFVSYEDCKVKCEMPLGTLSQQAVTEKVQNRPRSERHDKVDCVVSPWSEWSQCSTSCGTGFILKVRMVKVSPRNGGKKCPKKLSRRKKCRNMPCRPQNVFSK